MEGFGEKSYQNLINAIEEAKNVSLERVLYSLGIKGIGLSMAKLICGTYPLPLSRMKELTVDKLVLVDGIGEKLAESFTSFFARAESRKLVEQLESILHITMPEPKDSAVFEGLVFVITGSLTQFTNRKECKTAIEQAGGKVSGSVSKNTNYLVNNDIQSMSSKNKKAKELGVPVITEEQLLAMLNQK